MQKISKKLCLLALMLSSSTFASKDNYIYVSAGLGIFQADFDANYLDQTDTIHQNFAQTALQHGYTGGIAIGYSRLLTPDYFAGAEISANLDGHNASFQSGASSSSFSDQTQIKNHVDLTFVPGMKLSHSIITYLKLGLSYASIQDHLTSPAGFTPDIITTNSNKNALGFAAGLGVARSLTENTALFVEANYHDYGSIDFSNFQNFSATYTHSAHVYSYDVMAGVSYSFNV